MPHDETVEPQRSFLHLKPTKAQKLRWVQAAQASPERKLEGWVFTLLDREADTVLGPEGNERAEPLQ